jgi:hypothetical protein
LLKKIILKLFNYITKFRQMSGNKHASGGVSGKGKDKET